MEFTYEGYCGLIENLRRHGYILTDYHNYKNLDGHKICILRHDIDQSIDKALRLAELENELGVKSTWFVLTTGNFYNPFSRENRKKLKKFVHMGHKIGLHFDETSYDNNLSVEEKIEWAEKEKEMLETALQIPIRSVSMHRPSKEFLSGNWEFDGMVNTYSSEFFSGFKYLSDSRRRWREPVNEIIKSETYKKLHILTHAFWYNDKLLDIHDSLLNYMKEGVQDRYRYTSENITDLKSIISEEEVRCP